MISLVFIGQCSRACSGHGWCQFNSCRYSKLRFCLEWNEIKSFFFQRCDSGFSGDFCEISNTTLFNRGSFLIDNNDNQTDLITYQGIF
jgi:hypothetical protein